MSLLLTAKPELVNALIDRLEMPVYEIGHAYGSLIKSAGDATLSYAMSGRLYLSQSGWLMLSVPNSLVRGIFDALHEPGISLPKGPNGSPFNAHITVMRPEEIETIGGPDKVTERNHQFHYTLGPIKEVIPDGWKDVSKCWFIEVSSPELKNLRKSYGLTPLPNDNKYQFHITAAIRAKNVLKPNTVSKAAESNEMDILGLLKSAQKQPIKHYDVKQILKQATKGICIRHTSISVIDGLKSDKKHTFDGHLGSVSTILEDMIKQFHKKHVDKK